MGTSPIRATDSLESLGRDSLAMVQGLALLTERYSLLKSNKWLPIDSVAEQASFLLENDPETVAIMLGTDSSVVYHADDSWLTRQLLDEFFNNQFANLKERAGMPVPGVRNPPAVFILSSSRSGSTLLRVMLAGHPDLFVPPELNLLKYADMAERDKALNRNKQDDRHKSGLGDALMYGANLSQEEARSIIEDAIHSRMPCHEMYALLQSLVAPRILVDKSPAYCQSLNALFNGQRWFSRALYIHLVRSPAAAINSCAEYGIGDQLNQPNGPSWSGSEFYWNIALRNIETFFTTLPQESVIRVRYEDILRDPESVMQRLCVFLDIEYTGDLLRPFDPGRMTESIYQEGRADGDPKLSILATHINKGRISSPKKQIDDRKMMSSLSERLKLSRLTWQHAARYGYAPGHVSPVEEWLEKEMIIHREMEEMVELPPDFIKRQHEFMLDWKGEQTSENGFILGLNTDGSRQPLFWCFQENAEFQRMAGHLGQDQPVYALRSGHLTMRYTRAGVRALASHYVREIKGIQPQGPYLLGGNCQGARIIWHVARILRKREEQVTLLAMLEHVAPKPYDGPIALFFCEQSKFNPLNSFDDPVVGLSRLYTGRFSLDTIPGEHGPFFQKDKGRTLCRKLARRILAAQAAENRSTLDKQFWQAEISGPESLELKAGDRKASITARVRNASTATWPANTLCGISLATIWYDSKYRVISRKDGRTPLPQKLLPGQELEMTIKVTPPSQPGKYYLELDMVEDGIGWFRSREDPRTLITVTVRRGGLFRR